MARLTGGAEAPNPRAWLADDDAEDLARASREIDAQRHPDPGRPRSRWERVRLEGEVVEVEVEQLAPPGEEG